MSSAKDKAVNEGDVLGIWIRGNIRKGLTSLKFKRVKDMLNSQNESFGQRQAGFNRRLKEKLESLGYEVGGREDKGDLYIKCAEERPEDEEVAEEPKNLIVIPKEAPLDMPPFPSMMGLQQPTKEDMEVGRPMPTKEQLESTKKKNLREALKKACDIWNPKE
jgi:hypothetical protein